MSAARVLGLSLAAIVVLGCVTPATIRPIYATRAVSVVEGEIAVAPPAAYAGSGGDPSSLGAVRLDRPLDQYFDSALRDELQAFGLRINADARLEIEADIVKAETLWAKQGPGGVFSTEVQMRFTVRDRLKKGAVVYQRVHEGAASHSQSYGGYPASGSVVDALSQAYTRLLSDAAFYSLLVKDYGFAVASASPPGPDSVRAGQALQLVQADLEAFPILMKHYDDHPVGRIVLKNAAGDAVTNVAVSLYVKEFMDNPKASPGLAELRDTASVDLFALFNASILSITEGTKVSGVIHAEYTGSSGRCSQDFPVTLRVFGRNALTWDDDRKAAAFVTARDPGVLRFARNCTGVASGLAAGNLSRSLQRAIILHEALAQYGIRYEVVPASVFKAKKDSRAVDYLQFPRQTLDYRAGNCSDITVLYTALLASVGVDTAFITVPGHIFMAFALDRDRTTVPQPAEFPGVFIERDGVTWIPVETTMVTDSFARAWQEGAREWTDCSRDGTAAFYPVRDAWQAYEPVDFSEQSAPAALPALDQLARRSALSFTEVAAWQMAPAEARLKQARAARPADPAADNRLAVLYARYGRYELAAATLQEIAATGSYLPAVINLGTARYMMKDYAGARSWYQKAATLQPGNAAVIAMLSQVCFDQGDFHASMGYYDRLKAVDPAMAERYAYLAGTADTRAAERVEPVSWLEE